MADEPLSTPPTTEVPLPNSPEARTPDGTLKDQISTQPTTTEAPIEPVVTKPVVPESYTFTAPEGKSLDQSFLDTATPVFKELGLDQAQAQKLVDTYNKLSDATGTKLKDEVSTMRTGWQKEIKDQFGTSLDAKLADFGRMKDTVFADDKKGREAFETALDLTGAGDHPAIFSAMMKLAEKFTEGRHVSGSGPSSEGQKAPGAAAKPTTAQAMWPGLPSSNAA